MTVPIGLGLISGMKNGTGTDGPKPGNFWPNKNRRISSAFSFMIYHSIFYIAIQHFKSRFKRSYLKIYVILDFKWIK